MKKLSALVLALSLIFSLSACGNKEKNSTVHTQSPPAPQGGAASPSTPALTTPSQGVSTTAPIADNIPSVPEYDSEAINAEAAVAFDRFSNAIQHVESNENDKYGFFLRSYDTYFETHVASYLKFTDGTREEWESKSLYERFLWYNTYLRILENLYMGEYDHFFGSESDFLNNCLGSKSLFVNGVGQAEYDEYVELMLWQYEFIKDYATVYNFMTGQSYQESQIGE